MWSFWPECRDDGRNPERRWADDRAEFPSASKVKVALAHPSEPLVAGTSESSPLPAARPRLDLFVNRPESGRT